jgi:hypothetical protein
MNSIPTTYCVMILKTNGLHVYSYLCIDTATHLNTIYLDWLQAVFEKNLTCT